MSKKKCVKFHRMKSIEYFSVLFLNHKNKKITKKKNEYKPIYSNSTRFFMKKSFLYLKNSIMPSFFSSFFFYLCIEAIVYCCYCENFAVHQKRIMHRMCHEVLYTMNTNM